MFLRGTLMAVLPIYNCYHPILKEKTKSVEQINGEIKQLVDDMFETMYDTGNGVGLAANQVGVSKSLFIVDISTNEKAETPIVMINPIITSFSDDMVEDKEGCLSVPDLYEKVLRPNAIEVTYFDINGKEIQLAAEGFLARVIQHEYDHLNGILFYEKISQLRKTLAKNKLKKIEKGITLPEYKMVMPDGTIL